MAQPTVASGARFHLEINARTLDIKAIEVTTNAIGDAPTLPGFLAQTPKSEQILSVGKDGAYDTRDCHAASAGHGTDAVIPLRRNRQPWAKGGPGLDARNKALRATKRLGHAIWKKWSGYHRRSLGETKMHCFKSMGHSVAARTFDLQVTELEVGATILNRLSKIGTPVTVRAA